MRTTLFVMFAAVAALAALAAGIGPAAGAPAGGLTQKAGLDACIALNGLGGACREGRGLDGPQALALSPDGAHVYAVSFNSNALTVFDRDPVTGVLTQKPGTAGCVAEAGDGTTCADGKGLTSPVDVALSADGRSVYVTFVTGNGIAVFARDPQTGRVSQPAGTAACVSASGNGGDCATVGVLNNVNGVTVSPGGEHVYATSGSPPGAVVVFDRDQATGVLTPKQGTDFCVSETGHGGICVAGPPMNGASGIALSPDGRSAYVAAPVSGSLVTFTRDTTTGVLSPAGCISWDGSLGACTAGRGLIGVTAVAVSAGGEHVYAAGDSSVATFDRSASTGALTQKPGAAGCIAEAGDGTTCAEGTALQAALALVLSPEGDSVYVASRNSFALAVLDRDPVTGVLAQKAGTAGCVSDDGLSGACADGVALTDAEGVAVSPDGANVYAVAYEGGLSVFDRIRAPSCAPGAATTGHGRPVVLRFRCDGRGAAISGYEIVQWPAAGSLGALDQVAGTVAYIPPQGFAGQTTFTFRAVSSNGASPAAPFVVAVQPATPGPGPVAPGAGEPPPPVLAPLPPALRLTPLRRTAVVRSGTRLRVGYRVSAPARVRARLARGKVVVMRAERRARRGVNVLSFTVPRRAKPGRYTLTLVARASGRTVSARVLVRVRPTLRRA